MAIYRYQHGDRPLDGYTIQHALGRGGFGEVYHAVSDSGREVALKAVQNYEDIELRGITHCMNLKHPQLIAIYDIKHNADGLPFVLMEYVDGPSLRQILDAHPDGLGPAKAAFFLREIARGLSYLHDQGIAHRDLKPHNVFYEQGIVKIGDYSLSKLITTSHRTGHSITVGTVHYMAPEISLGRYDHAVDIYALGVLLYEMLTGQPPFLGDSMGEVLMKHVSGTPDVSGIAQPFARVIEKAMEKNPDDRYATAKEMVDDLFGHQDLQNSVAALGPESLTVVAGRAIWKEGHADIPTSAHGPSPRPATPHNSELPPPLPLTNAVGESQHSWVWAVIGGVFLIFVMRGGGQSMEAVLHWRPIFIAMVIGGIWLAKKRRRAGDALRASQARENAPEAVKRAWMPNVHTANRPTAKAPHKGTATVPLGPPITTPDIPIPPDETAVSPHSRLVSLVLSAVPFVLWFLPVAGLHRFYVGRIGSGVLWVFTWGLFGFGTVVDMVMISLGQFRDADGRRVLSFRKDRYDDAQPVNEYSAVSRETWSDSRIGLRLGNVFLNLVGGVLLLAALGFGLLVAVDVPSAVSTGVFGHDLAHQITRETGVADWHVIFRIVLTLITVLAGTFAAAALVLARRDTTWAHLFRVPLAAVGFVGSVCFIGAATRFGRIWGEVAEKVSDHLIGGAFETLFRGDFWPPFITGCVAIVVSMFLLAWPARTPQLVVQRNMSKQRLQTARTV